MNIKIKRYFAFSGFIAILILAFVYFEFIQSREELLNTMRNESVNLCESLSLSFENALLTNDEFESQMMSKLDAISSLIAHYRKTHKDYNYQIQLLKEKFELDNVSIIDKDYKIIYNSINNTKELSQDFINEIVPLFNGEFLWLDLGIIFNEPAQKEMYTFVKYSSDYNFCVIIGINSEKIMSFRRKIGIGKQLQEIADNQDIIYIILQDKDGIISATKGINEISSIESDNFLVDCINTDKTNTRITEYNGQKIYEAAKTITLSDSSKILNRIALSLNNIMSIQQKSMRRVVLIGLGIFIVFSLSYFFLLTRKGYDELKVEHKKIKSYNDLVLENMADAVITLDNEYKLKSLNKKAIELFNIDEKDIGKNYYEIFSRDLLNINDYKNHFGEIKNYEVKADINNHSFNFEIHNSSILKQNGEIDFIISIIKNITEQIKLKEQIERKEKLSAMGELAAGVAHEIRNPINSVNIIMQRLALEFEPTSDKDEYKDLINTVRTEIIRINNIIKQFLEYARPPKLTLSENSIKSTFDECIKAVESEAQLKNIKIIRDFSNDFIFMFDKEKIKQAIINLLKNSIDAISNDGTIICNLSKLENNVILNISDDGAGIPDSVKSKIFNLYFTTKSNGNGLGLSIVHQIISEHNGTISLESEENVGTTFTIKLPIS